MFLLTSCYIKMVKKTTFSKDPFFKIFSGLKERHHSLGTGQNELADCCCIKLCWFCARFFCPKNLFLPISFSLWFNTEVLHQVISTPLFLHPHALCQPPAQKAHLPNALWRRGNLLGHNCSCLSCAWTWTDSCSLKISHSYCLSDGSRTSSIKAQSQINCFPFQFHPHTTPQAHEQSTASLQKPEFSSPRTYQSIIQRGERELTSTRRVSGIKKERKALAGGCQNSSALTRCKFSSGVII